MEALLKVLATSCAGIFTGAAMYMSMVQHPALLETRDVFFQAPFFRRVYFYAARMQAPLSLLSGVSACAVAIFCSSSSSSFSSSSSSGHSSSAQVTLWRFGPRQIWLLSGLSMLTIGPFTFWKMIGLNQEICATKQSVKKGNRWMQQKLRQWGALHSLRVGVSLSAYVAMVSALCWQSSSAESSRARSSCSIAAPGAGSSSSSGSLGASGSTGSLPSSVSSSLAIK